MAPLKFLTADQKSAYDRDGYILLTGILTGQEIAKLSDEYDSIFQKIRETKNDYDMTWVGNDVKDLAKNVDTEAFLLTGILTGQEIAKLSDEYDRIFQKIRETKNDYDMTWVGNDVKDLAKNVDTEDDTEVRAHVIPTVHNIQMHSAAFNELLNNKNLLDAVEDIMGTENIVLHHTKAHLKPPEKGSPFPMHQDFPYFPYKKHSMLAVFVHMDDTSPENGGLAVYPGSHKLGPLPFTAARDARGRENYYVDTKKWPLEKATPVPPVKKGDIIIFSYLTLHGSYLNLSDRTRKMFLIQLRAGDDADEAAQEKHKSMCQGLTLRGMNLTELPTWVIN